MANNLNIDSERVAFRKWWGASKYMQVVVSSGAAEQAAFDGWLAARALLQPPLTEADIYQIADEIGLSYNTGRGIKLFARAIEAKISAPLPPPGEAGELAKLRELAEAAHAWWMQQKPFSWKIEEHYAEPAHYCTGAGKKLAELVAALPHSMGKGEV